MKRGFSWPLLLLALVPLIGRGAAEPDRAENLIVARTNELRVEQGLAKLSVEPRLQAAAQEFAEYLARTTEYSHTADGRQPWERAEAQGYDYCQVRENIAYQYRSEAYATQQLAQAFVDGWRNSPGHRRNMLAPHVTETGVGVVHSQRNGYYYAVQMFGRPKAARTSLEVSNRTGQQLSYALSTEAGTKRYTLAPRETRVHRQCQPTRIDFGWTANNEALLAQDGLNLRIEPGQEGYRVVRD